MLPNLNAIVDDNAFDLPFHFQPTLGQFDHERVFVD
jgi:hypothetical protein